MIIYATPPHTLRRVRFIDTANSLYPRGLLLFFETVVERGPWRERNKKKKKKKISVTWRLVSNLVERQLTAWEKTAPLQPRRKLSNCSLHVRQRNSKWRTKRSDIVIPFLPRGRAPRKKHGEWELNSFNQRTRASFQTFHCYRFAFRSLRCSPCVFGVINRLDFFASIGEMNPGRTYN